MSGVQKLFQVGQLGQVGRLLRAHILKVFKRTNKVFFIPTTLFTSDSQGGLTKQDKVLIFLYSIGPVKNQVGWRDAQDDLGGQVGHGGELCKV